MPCCCWRRPAGICGHSQPLIPPAPDYSRPQDWLAFPGRNGFERSSTAADTPVPEAEAAADVFFIHPTTYLKNDVWNVALDAPTRYGAPVLLNQASAFNGCCRIFAPHYRQASLKALNDSRPAVDLAFSDVQKAFHWYLANENHGRPFILQRSAYRPAIGRIKSAASSRGIPVKSAGAAPKSANLGSETLTETFNDASPNKAIILPPPVRALTGAQCHDGLLDVDISPFARGYTSLLRVLYGSFHVLDYGLFYENIRENALMRTRAWRAANPGGR